MAHHMKRMFWRFNSSLCLFGLAVVLPLGAFGCGDRNAVRVQLEGHRAQGQAAGRMEVRAQVTGPQAGLRYKWFSVHGECDPQESEWPSTLFEFANAMTRDRVSVEVWRGNDCVARAELDVKFDGVRPRPVNDPLPKVDVQISSIPPYEPEGGPDTRADISGKVTGEIIPDYKVVVYARADAWYIQPSAYAEHVIGADGTWSTWTHTGSSYAVLVVRPGFDPFLRLDVLPQVGDHVLARAIVEGVRQ
jgi:hypothetical protein